MIWVVVLSVLFITAIIFYIMLRGFSKKHISNNHDGLFIADVSNPNEIHYIIDVKMDIEEIMKKKEIRLKVCKMDEGSCE